MIGTGLRARTSRQMSRPDAARHHDVEDQQVEAGVLAAELAVGVLAVDGQGDLEALLLERVADGVAHRGLVVCDQDPGPHSTRALTLQGSWPVAPRAGGPRTCCPRPRPTRPRSRPPSRRPSGARSRARGRSPPARASPSRGRSARRSGRPPPAAIPLPVSIDLDPHLASPSAGIARTIVTVPGAGVFLNAFVSRPISTWRSSTRSPCAARSARDARSRPRSPPAPPPPRSPPRPRARRRAPRCRPRRPPPSAPA